MKAHTTAEVAARHGCSPDTVARACKAGHIPGAVKAGRDWLIPEWSDWRPQPIGRPRKDVTQ